jgi:hypothetical protein
MLALFRRARGLAALGAAGIAFAASPAAHADSTSDAQAKAQALLAQVHRLQQQVKQAETRYDNALAGVAASVNAAIHADETKDDVAAQTTAYAVSTCPAGRSLFMPPSSTPATSLTFSRA